MELNKNSLDRYLTTEPDNGYNNWLERVWDLIPEAEISGEELEANETFFDDLQLEVSFASGSDFINPKIAADIIIRRYKILKKNPDCKTWAELKAKIKSHNL